MVQEEAGADRRREENPGEIRRWLEEFLDSRGALIEPVGGVAEACAVVIRDIEHGRELWLDVGAAPFVRAACEGGRAVVISRLCGDFQVATAPLRLWDYASIDGHELVRASYPSHLMIERRRREFRAELRKDLHCRVLLTAELLHRPLAGDLVNLSMSGCRLLLPDEAIHLVDSTLNGARLTLSFPNGEESVLGGDVRHFEPAREGGGVFAGFEFEEQDAAGERLLWHYVREIEREWARRVETGRDLPPSGLFSARDAISRGHQGAASPAAPEHATAMAQLLNALGNGVGGLFVDLKHRDMLDPAALSRLSDGVISLSEQDRQELLFALICLPEQPPLIRHCLALAVRLTDIGARLKLERQQVKAVAACALVHDLALALDAGTGINPSVSPVADPASVARLSRALTRCGWLPQSVISETIDYLHARLRGGGIAEGSPGEEVGHLGRLAAVVDEIDLRCRAAEPERALSYAQARQLMLQDDAVLAVRWVRFFFTRFGELPVGARVRAASGEQFWVRRLHADRECTVLVPAPASSFPTTADVRHQLTGDAVTLLGPLTEIPGPGPSPPGS